MLQTVKRRIRGSWAGPRLTALYYRLHGKDTRGLFYDLQTVEVMRRVLRTDSSCIDVGAHEGSILVDMARLSPQGRHIAFEPLPHLALRLRVAFPDVDVVEAAASDYTGVAQFLHVRNAPAYSGLKERIYDRPDPEIEPIEVQVVRLDDTVPASEDIAFVKIDVEGGEYGVLSGARATIKRCRPIIVFEAGKKSTGQYGTSAEQIYGLLTSELGCDVSTMSMWLAGGDKLTLEAFERHWDDNSEYYFIAYPAHS